MSNSSSSSMSDFDMDMGDVTEGVEIRVQASVQQSVRKAQEIIEEDPPEFGIDEDDMEDWEDDSKAPSIYKQKPEEKKAEVKKLKYYHLFDDPPKRKRGKLDVEGRFYRHQEKVNDKIKSLAKVLDEKQIEECTFKPTILNKSESRSMPDFLKQMKKYDEVKKDKLKLKLNQKEEELKKMAARAKPRLCKNSRKINEKKSDLGAERPPILKLTSKLEEEISTFKPQVNLRSHEMLRDKPIDRILYEDALRRYSKTTRESPPVNDKHTSVKSEKVLLEKFKKEYAEMFSYLDLDNSMTLNYTKFTTLLYNMSFISRSSSKLSKQRSLAVELWSLLGGDASGIVTYKNLLAGLACVMNFRDPAIPTHNGAARLGSLIKGEFCIAPGELSKIHRHFHLLFEERTVPKSQSLNTSFESITGADARRKSDTLHEDWLIQEKGRLQEKWESIRQKNLIEEVSQCSFRPRINRGPRTIASSTDLNDSNMSHYSFFSETKSQSQRRNDILYEYSKLFNQQRHNSFKNQIDSENLNEVKSCTFKPKIRKRMKVDEVPEAKGVKELINRLRSARKDKKDPNNSRPFVCGLERSTSRMSIDLNSSVSSTASFKSFNGSNNSFSVDSDKIMIKVNLPNGKRTVFQIAPGENRNLALKKFVEKNSIKGEAELKLRNQLKKVLE